MSRINDFVIDTFTILCFAPFTVIKEGRGERISLNLFLRLEWGIF